MSLKSEITQQDAKKDEEHGKIVPKKSTDLRKFEVIKLGNNVRSFPLPQTVGTIFTLWQGTSGIMFVLQSLRQCIKKKFKFKTDLAEKIIHEENY